MPNNAYDDVMSGTTIIVQIFQILLIYNQTEKWLSHIKCVRLEGYLLHIIYKEGL